MMRLASMAFVMIVLGVPWAWAERKVRADEPIVARLTPNQPTLVVLPELIHGVFVVVDPQIISVTYGGPMVALQALVPELRGRMFVVGQSGKDYEITYQVREPGDNKIVVLSAQQQAGLVAPTVTAPDARLDVPMFLRALRTGTPVPGQQALDVPAPLLQDARVHIVGWQSVQAATFVGLVVAVRNATEHPLTLDIRYGEPGMAQEVPGVIRVAGWVFPPHYTLRALTAEREVLGVGEVGHVYVVMERR